MTSPDPSWQEIEAVTIYLEDYLSGLKEWLKFFKVCAKFENVDHGKPLRTHSKSMYRHLNATRFNKILKEISLIEKEVFRLRSLLE